MNVRPSLSSVAPNAPAFVMTGSNLCHDRQQFALMRL